MSERDLHRREFLAQLGVGAASALAFSGAVVLACGDARDPLVGALEGLFDDPEAARAIGAAWIAEQPTPPDAEALLTAIADGRIEAARALARSDPAALLAQLRARHHADFDFGRTAEVRGWLLSLTEARVCGALARAGGRG
ncbi:MAG: hypothetical protein JRG80_09750 [Deltaproteobacteria bacterium]|nr:hypothetical protein [Deltaproteobacteria bacterium]